MNEPKAQYCQVCEWVKNLANQQADDEGLWFEATTAAEAYLQQELRKLHHCIESELKED